MIILFPVQHCSDEVACLLLFINERQNIWYMKYHERAHLTDNEVMSTQWFTNMYRELDRGTQYFQSCLLDTTLAGYKPSKKDMDARIVKEVLWKSIVYRLSNKVQTFKQLGGIPNIDDYKDFKRGFQKVFEQGQNTTDQRKRAFTAAHQNNGERRYYESLEFVLSNLDSLTEKVMEEAEQRSARGVFQVMMMIMLVVKGVRIMMVMIIIMMMMIKL